MDDSLLASSLPPDLQLVEVSRINGEAQQAIVAEVLPARPDVLSLLSSKGKIDAGDTYQITSSVSVADLPQRVRDLGVQLTSEADTPYEKAKAIEDHLASFTYTLKLEPPPYNADGVDHFLFTLQKGYSEYFASAMTVLLRTVGVPARLATGYTAGDKMPEQELYRVTDSHSHAWVEVFFPAYGWISFEPTPGASLPDTLLLDSGEPSGEAAGTAEGDPLEVPCFEALERCVDASEAPLADGTQMSPDAWSGKLLTLFTWLLGGLGIAALLAGTAALLWKRYMTPSEDPG